MWPQDIPADVPTFRALLKDMHEFHVDQDHAMCNIQNRTIPVAHRLQLKKLSVKNVKLWRSR
jgi:hypothetical protein